MRIKNAFWYAPPKNAVGYAVLTRLKICVNNALYKRLGNAPNMRILLCSHKNCLRYALLKRCPNRLLKSLFTRFLNALNTRISPCYRRTVTNKRNSNVRGLWRIESKRAINRPCREMWGEDHASRRISFAGNSRQSREPSPYSRTILLR